MRGFSVEKCKLTLKITTCSLEYLYFDIKLRELLGRAFVCEEENKGDQCWKEGNAWLEELKEELKEMKSAVALDLNKL